MKSFSMCVVLLILLAMPSAIPSALMKNDESIVAALDTEYQAAVKKNDAATMDRILADDFVLVTGKGKVLTKADLLNEARAKEVNYEHQEDSNQKVRIWGNTAVVTALLWAKGSDHGKPFEYKLWFSDTYVRTSTGWRYVFAQASLPLPEVSPDNAKSSIHSPQIDIEPRRTEVTKSTNQHSEAATASQPEHACCPIVELRQYTLHPGKRDVLIELFDREFVESQETLKMNVIGQFRDLDDPNRFVWLRGFSDMPARAQALKAFYGGPVWKAHSEVANATMIDSDNVLLLRPARPESGLLLGNHRPPPGTNEAPKGLVVATVYYLDVRTGDDFVDFFERALKPVLIDTGASILAYFVTEKSANTFPALPVREGEHVFVWFMGFEDQAAYERHAAALARSREWSDEVSQELARRLKRKPEVLRLLPTARSQLRGSSTPAARVPNAR